MTTQPKLMWSTDTTAEGIIFDNDKTLNDMILSFSKEGKITLRGPCEVDGNSVFTFQDKEKNWYFIVKNTEKARLSFNLNDDLKYASATSFIIPVNLEII